MEYDDRVVELIKKLEGFRSEAYPDMNGVLTIGYGHTNANELNPFKKGDTITKEEAERILLEDLDEANLRINNMSKNRDLTLTQEQQDLAVAVYFHRPWALQDDGLETIAQGNIDLFNMDQKTKIEDRAEEAGYNPKGILNRLVDEIAFINEFDAPDETSGNATDTKEPITIYLNGKPQLVDANVADMIVNNTDYSYESGSPQTQGDSSLIKQAENEQLPIKDTKEIVIDSTIGPAKRMFEMLKSITKVAK